MVVKPLICPIILVRSFEFIVSHRGGEELQNTIFPVLSYSELSAVCNRNYEDIRPSLKLFFLNKCSE